VEIGLRSDRSLSNALLKGSDRTSPLGATKRAIALGLTLFEGKRSQFQVVDTITAIAHNHYLSRGSSLQGAIAGLQHKGLIYGAEQGYRLALPLFALWLRQRLS
jgi:hypothetical protein